MINIHAHYTVVLKSLLDHQNTNEAIQNALANYPLYAAKKIYDLIPTREELNKKLLNHYKYREIGFETVGRFIDELEITMNEIMPLYNERFKTIETMADLDNPFDNVDVVETFDEERESTNSNTSSGSGQTSGNVNESVTGTSKNKKVHTDTPGSELTIPANEIDSIDYANDVEWDKNDTENTATRELSDSSTTESESNSEGRETVRHTVTRKGNQGVNTYAHDMNEFRTSIIDVVDEIINDPRLNELFMMVF